MDDRLPFGVAAADAYVGTAAPAAGIRAGRRLTATLLLAAAALDLTRCSLVVMTARHPAPAAALVAAGLAAAALSVRTARGCQAGRRWASRTALLIGTASAPQAAASGFRPPYAIPDTATAALGVLLAVAVLATAGPAAQPGHDRDDQLSLTESHPLTSTAAALVQTRDPRDAAPAPWSAAGGPPPRGAPRLCVRSDPHEARTHARPEVGK
jgi:hypothetical protein